MRKSIAVGTMLYAVGSLALAGNVIELWGPGVDYYQPGDHYSININLRIVAIHHGSNPDIPWYFQAYDDVTGAPGTIDSIQIDATGEVGEIHLSVIGDASHPLGGAAYLKKIDLLTGADAPTTIDEVDITVDFGDAVLPGVMKSTYAGSLTVGNDVLRDIEITHAITGATTIYGGLKASLSCDSLGDLTVLGPGDPDHPASITIRGPYAHTLAISHSVHTLNVDGDVSGPLTIGQDVTSFDIGTLTSRVFIGGNVGDDATGHLTINGMRADAELEIGGDAHFVIIQNGLGANCTVHIVGDVGVADVTRGFEVRANDPDPNLAVQLEGTVEIVGNAWDWHAHCWTMSTARVQIGGDVNRLGFDFDLQAGAVCRVDGSVGWVIVFGIAQAGISGSLRGTLEAGGNLEHYSGRPNSLIINHGELASTGRLTIGGSAAGVMAIPDGPCAGTFEIGQDFQGRLVIGTEAASQDFTGWLHVQGNFESQLEGDSLEVFGALRDPNNNGTGGRIVIDGGFGQTSDSSIRIHGLMAPGRPGIAVDYDGYRATDRWGAYGSVWVDGQEHTGNTPSSHIYEITGCKGDGDNNGSVGPTDTVAMLLAMMGEAFYRPTYPGLEGSMLFHCDLTGPITNECDGLINFLDFDFLPLRFGTCSTACGAVDSDDGPSPAELAAVLAQHVPLELRGVLRDVVDDLRQNHPTPARRVYWQAVRQYLGE